MFISITELFRLPIVWDFFKTEEKNRTETIIQNKKIGLQGPVAPEG